MFNISQTQSPCSHVEKWLFSHSLFAFSPLLPLLCLSWFYYTFSESWKAIGGVQQECATRWWPKTSNLFSLPFLSFLAMSTITPMSLFNKGSSDSNTVKLEVGFASLDIYLCWILPAISSHRIWRSFTFSPYLCNPEYLTAHLITLFRPFTDLEHHSFPTQSYINLCWLEFSVKTLQDSQLLFLLH